MAGDTAWRDAFAAVKWLLTNSDRKGVDPDRIAIMGESAGGGIAAGVAILARDAGMTLARQILIYPMLDDRTTITDQDTEPFTTWNWHDNATAWRAVLGELFGADDIDWITAPARLTEFQGLCDAYVDVGELDIFRDEDIDYAARLGRAGVNVELHVHRGAPHAFEVIAPESALARRALEDRVRVIRSL
ncbi:hypothetical protein AX769_08415 [Frondihabitans sp. PAMC 28766]|uniref:alpha/beta hydrolase fold domain-containing protein n=1 Tax=Frondihabitans sp. PAMC 28766 TaxID=1795630 RepID=UPI00078EBECB|nr:alpha/beta hydrolase fold domain-containing protein [Frondihabitans sp. PAMC 28766]AMM20184.1 hypothetical protein AX769_08415 [Frondihabitans sp. PAMC 28766]